ncbi:SURF1 family protein [Nocardioides marmoriginsengisoli]|nr:SURF1 family protein [Nocardioides marmoriginsengisoli]
MLLRPRYWPGHLAMVVCVSIAVGLGVWQLDAWQTRRADAARDISNDAPVALATLMSGDSPFPGRSLGRPVTLSGTWMSDSTVYVSDRFRKKERGYWVVTPVKVDGSESAMPVVRGWAPEPKAPAPSGDVTVTGWLQATEGSGPIDEDPHDDVIPMMRLATLVEHVDADLFSAYVVARDVSGAPDGLESVTLAAIPEVSGFTALRNFLYAIEWWVFAAFAFFVWFRWCRDSYEVATAVPDEDDGNDEDTDA